MSRNSCEAYDFNTFVLNSILFVGIQIENHFLLELIKYVRNYHVYMRYWLFFFMLSAAYSSRAQHVWSAVVNTTGSTYTQKDVTYEWSVGELALVETMVNNQVNITNGFLQPVAPTLLNIGPFIVFPINILSPNGDGVNDVWEIKDIEKFPQNEVTVFDRAGRTIYHAKKYQNNWNGYLSGAPLSEGTYYYIIKLERDRRSELIKGYITILN